MTERLTRHELSWLLAQEARNAAAKLRRGVGVDVTPEAPSIQFAPEEMSGGIESTLDKLEDVVGQLASLHGPSAAPRRRGRIDLATLVWQVAPDARTQLEMGEGTCVNGDEGELLRMLQILIGQSGDPASTTASASISIRREGADVKVSVHLGPDKPPTFDQAREWLSRMATRLGGRLDLDGVTQTLVLPADVDERVQEIQELRRELAEAQAQGQAYARELAAVFTREGVTTLAESKRPPQLDGLPVLVTSARSVGTATRGVLAAIGRDLAPLRTRQGEEAEIAASVGRHLAAALEIVGDLSRLGSFAVGELPRPAEIADLVREVVKQDTMRAARRGVTPRVEGNSSLEEVVPASGTSTLLSMLLAHVVGVSPEGSEVVVTIAEGARGTVVTFDDAGPSTNVTAGGPVWSAEWDAALVARGGSLPLIAAHALAAHLRFPLEASDAPSGGGRLELTIPRSP